jgi:hypothetical protein
VRKVAVRKTLTRRAPAQASSQVSCTIFRSTALALPTFVRWSYLFFQTSTEENSSEGEQSSPRGSYPRGTERSTTQSQTDSPTSASRKRSTPEPAALQPSVHTRSRIKRRCVQRARTGPQASSPSQEVSKVTLLTARVPRCLVTNWIALPFPLQINETSSGVVEEVPMPPTAPGPSNSPRVTGQSSDQHTAKPIVTTSASLPFLGEVHFPLSLLPSYLPYAHPVLALLPGVRSFELADIRPRLHRASCPQNR